MSSLPGGLAKLCRLSFNEDAAAIFKSRLSSCLSMELRLSLSNEQGYKPADEPASQYQTIPMNKIEDFGVHCQSYYGLDISYFKSELDSHMLDLLWNKYWVNTLSSSPLLATRDLATGQMRDIGVPFPFPSPMRSSWPPCIKS